MNRATTADFLAQKFHEAYERLAPEHNYDTRPESAVPWSQVPEENKKLMRAVVQELLDGRLICIPLPRR